MKKVLIGVAVAFGALMLLGVVIGGWWVKRTVGGMTESFEEVGANADRATQLNERFRYDEPPEDRVVALEEDRFQIWLKVSRETKEQLEAFNKSIAEDRDTGAKDGVEGMKEAFARAKLGTQMVTRIQEATLNALEASKMSPAEYRTITRTVMRGMTFRMTEQVNASLAENLERMEKSSADAKAALNDPDLNAQQREIREKMIAAMEQNHERLKEQMREAEQDPDRDVLLANAPLIEAHEEAIKEVGAGAFSAGLFGSMTE